MIPTYLVQLANFNHMYKMSAWHVVYIRGLLQSLHKRPNYTYLTSTLQTRCVIICLRTKDIITI